MQPKLMHPRPFPKPLKDLKLVVHQIKPGRLNCGGHALEGEPRPSSQRFRRTRMMQRTRELSLQASSANARTDRTTVQDEVAPTRTKALPAAPCQHIRRQKRPNPKSPARSRLSGTSRSSDRSLPVVGFIWPLNLGRS